MPSSQTFSMGPVRDLLGRYIRPGMKVLDPFAGSGSTLVAARDLGRNGVGIEQEHEYANIVRRRLGMEQVPPLAGEEAA